MSSRSREPARVASPQRHLRRGFNWLGGATVVTRATDLATLLIVLLFLTKQQVGIASLVISIGAVVEALDGLGTREALVQAQGASRTQLDSLFWFILAAALVVGAVVALAAPLLGAIYGVAGMSVYLLAVAAKQPVVGAALIPLAMMNRDLQYERIAVVNVCATFGTALTRLVLAVSGAGVWALVAGYCASGLFTLIGAQIARPFWPRLRFRIASISPLVHFGTRAATSSLLEQLLKNVDYLLIGWFYGPAQLAVYRVAFEVAMEPVAAVGSLINRTALPVFAKAAAVKEHLTQSVIWSLRRLALLVAPMIAALILAAEPVTAMIHDGQGHSYAAAAVPLKVLAIAALLRVTSQLLYPIVIGTGRPALAARLSAVTLLLLTVGIVIVGLHFPARTGLIAVSAVWVAIYPVLLVWEGRYLRKHWDIRLKEFTSAFTAPSIGAVILVCFVEAAHLLDGGGDPQIQLGVVLTAAALTYGALFLHARQQRYGTA
jgi:O-antigen/teichoic acid export membrane protein